MKLCHREVLVGLWVMLLCDMRARGKQGFTCFQRSPMQAVRDEHGPHSRQCAVMHNNYVSLLPAATFHLYNCMLLRSAQLPAFVAVQIGGHLIPKGTWVHINIYGEEELAVQAMAMCLARPCTKPVLAVFHAFTTGIVWPKRATCTATAYPLSTSCPLPIQASSMTHAIFKTPIPSGLSAGWATGPGFTSLPPGWPLGLAHGAALAKNLQVSALPALPLPLLDGTAICGRDTAHFQAMLATGS